jgi:glycosyltransferase involved in cell wall biosynthesis
MDEHGSKRKLGVFFTLGMGLQDWAENGILERELLLYEQLESFDEIILYTYGDQSDHNLEEEIDDIFNIKCNHISMNKYLYSILLPFLHWKSLSHVDIVKTNQMMGAWSAVISKILWGHLLVVRTGYILSRFVRKQGAPKSKIVPALIIERICYRLSDGIITSSNHGYQYIENQYLHQSRHEIIPNYVDTELFKPKNTGETRCVCFLGRLEEQKNVLSLIKAIKNIDVSITIVGDGSLESKLRRYCRTHDINAKFLGRVPNAKLPEILTNHELFVLPSYYEGMPKALLEAMSCGLPPVATDIKANNEIIIDGRNGLLCETTPDSIRESILRFLNDDSLRTQVGNEARQTVRHEYSLKSIAEKENKFYEDFNV